MCEAVHPQFHTDIYTLTGFMIDVIDVHIVHLSDSGMVSLRWGLTKACLAAGLYPNLVRVDYQDSQFSGGKAGRTKFFAREHGDDAVAFEYEYVSHLHVTKCVCMCTHARTRVFVCVVRWVKLHPGSVNAPGEREGSTYWTHRWLIYGDKVKTQGGDF
eukprot:1181547-Prorocentrum_minimum.AAC.1